MQELAMTPSTLILLAVIIACAVLAIRRLRRRGMCDCDDHCSGCSGKDSAKGGCPSCQAAERMAAHLSERRS